KDRITSITSNGTNVAESIQWNPFGPLAQYNQENTISGLVLKTIMTRDLNYRTTNIQLSTSSQQFDGVSLSVDSKGRTTKRQYFLDTTYGIQDSYYLYDEEDHVVCETTTSVSSCPTNFSLGNVKQSHTASPPFTNAGDWKAFLRVTNTSTTNTVSLNTNTHQLSQLNH